jgi:cysteine synthase
MAMARYSSIVDTVGRTPVVRINHLAPAHVNLWVKSVTGPDAMRCAQELATKEGLFVGITSGATFAAALAIAKEAPQGSNILCMLPDTGERYLSTPLFADVPADMTAEEQEILRSTPFGQKAA